ncbi:MAG: hypothetical protein ACYCOR_10860 [Acidobacteriaceae bacterium]
MSDHNWVKHPHVDGDGEIAFAGPKGKITRKMVHGVFDWPTEIPVRAGFVTSQAPEELIRAQKEADIEEVRALAAKLGLVVSDGVTHREKVVVATVQEAAADEEAPAKETAKSKK